MTSFKNIIVAVTFIASALIMALSVTIQPANGEAIFRDPASTQAPIVSPSLDLLTLNVAHGRGTALNQILVSETQHRRNLDDIASIVISSNANAVKRGVDIRFMVDSKAIWPRASGPSIRSCAPLDWITSFKSNANCYPGLPESPQTRFHTT